MSGPKDDLIQFDINGHVTGGSYRRLLERDRAKRQMTEPTLPVHFDATYHRYGRIDVEGATCDVCRQPALCLTIDSSEGEYGAGSVCEACVGRLFAIRKVPA
jgi:hypothetical protein